MNKDQEILEEMVAEIIEEIAKHGKKGRLEDLLRDAAEKGFVRYEKKNDKWFIYSLKDRRQYISHLGETGVVPVTSFLRKLGYDK